jgi:hypothetical protein
MAFGDLGSNCDYGARLQLPQVQGKNDNKKGGLTVVNPSPFCYRFMAKWS